MSAVSLPTFKELLVEREGRLLRVTFNRPDAMNAVNLTLHDELVDLFWFCQGDPDSDVIVLTGAGRAFSAGGDLDHLKRNAEQPHLFDHEARMARRIVYTSTSRLSAASTVTRSAWARQLRCSATSFSPPREPRSAIRMSGWAWLRVTAGQ
jgi:enoyl-CoA hydratase/carnithine racemase